MISHQFFSLVHKIAINFPVFLLVFTWRGFFKALIAKLMGDDTAQREGFLTLNPLVHNDILGLTITLVIFFFLGWILSATVPPGMLVLLLLAFGVRWTIPVPVDDRNFTSYRIGGVLTALAGPFGNLFLACLTLLLAKLFIVDGLPRYAFVTLVEFLKSIIDVAIWFFILDLIPLPPFDGGQALKYLVPNSKKYIMDWLEEYSIYIIFLLFFLPYVSDIFWETLHLFNMVIKKFLFGLLF